MADKEGAWWLSFVDESDGHSLGVAIVTGVEGDSVADAAKRAWELEVNPGGQVMGIPIQNGEAHMWEVTQEDEVNRLLTPDEARALADRIDQAAVEKGLMEPVDPDEWAEELQEIAARLADEQEGANDRR